MLKYQQKLAHVFVEYRHALFHPILPKILHIVLMVLLLPFHLAFLALVAGFEIIFFWITVFRVPADFIQETIEENHQISPAGLFVVYCVSYPMKLVFDFITGILLVSLGWLFLFINLIGWIGSLGRIDFQPLLMQETPVSSSETEEKNP